MKQHDLWYLGVIVLLIGFSAALLRTGFVPRDCSDIATSSRMMGYTKGITETLDMKL